MKAANGLAVVLVSGLACGLSSPALASGTNPSSWLRARDWNLSGLNPIQVGGQPVWMHEFIAAEGAGGLGTANPWYTRPRGPMGYDADWYGSGTPAYSRANDVNPPIFRRFLTHNVESTVHDFVPAVRWMKPSNVSETNFTITGDMLVTWDGPNGVGQSNDVDVVIAKQDGALGTLSVLFSTTVSKPDPRPSVGDVRLIPINLSLQINEGDSILVTHRGRTSFTPEGNWINLADNLTIALIPAPGAMGLLAVAGIAMGRRRR